MQYDAANSCARCSSHGNTRFPSQWHAYHKLHGFRDHRRTEATQTRGRAGRPVRVVIERRPAAVAACTLPIRGAPAVYRGLGHAGHHTVHHTVASPPPKVHAPCQPPRKPQAKHATPHSAPVGAHARLLPQAAQGVGPCTTELWLARRVRSTGRGRRMQRVSPVPLQRVCCTRGARLRTEASRWCGRGARTQAGP